MKTILITGINGFLGSHLAKALSAEYHIIGLEYLLENLFRVEGCGFKVYTSEEDKEQIFIENEIFAIIHAATVYRRNIDESLESLIKANILLPVQLYELAEKYNCDMFINTDTFFNDPKFNYSYLPDYTLSKKQVIEWLKLITKNCKLVNMKIFHMYGPNDAPKKFIPAIIDRLKNNEPYIDITPGEQTRDFIYIDDVVNAYKVVLKSLLLESFTEFQIGTGNSLSIKEFLLLAKKALNSKSEFRFGILSYRDNEIMRSVANNTSLIDIGWEPLFSIRQGLNKIAQTL